MLCNEILTAALKLLGESGTDADNPDYAERAPYIIAAFVGEAAELDSRYRRAHGLAEANIKDTVSIPLTYTFPLSSRFASSCTLYLASLLICDESPELSETYYDRYCDNMSRISASLPFISEDTLNVYP